MFLLGVVVERLVIERVVGGGSAFIVVADVWPLDPGDGDSALLLDIGFRSVPYLSGSVDVLGLDVSRSRLVAFVIALAVTGAMYAFLRFASFGKAIRATAQHAEVAQVCGVDVRQVRMVTFGLGAAMAGVAGSLIVMIFAVNPEVGRVFIGRAFAIVVLGGLGSFVGAFVGRWGWG